MNILLTGGSGFIGRNLLENLKGYNILAPTSTELDLLRRDDLIQYVKSHKIDIILDCTCWNAYVNPKKDAKLVLVNNIKMFFHISCCSHLVKKIICFGSGAEYDRPNWKAMMPESYFGHNLPDDDYGISKYVNCLQAARQNNIYNLRLFSVFGPYEDLKRFVSYCTTKALNKEVIEMNQNRVFDFLYIDDLVKVVENFINHDFYYRTYNVCTSRGTELLQVANKVIKTVGHDVSVKIKKAGMDREYTGDNSLLMQEMEFQFEDIDVSILKLVEWYRSLQDFFPG